MMNGKSYSLRQKGPILPWVIEEPFAQVGTHDPYQGPAQNHAPPRHFGIDERRTPFGLKLCSYPLKGQPGNDSVCS